VKLAMECFERSPPLVPTLEPPSDDASALCEPADASNGRMASAGMHEFKIGQYVYYRARAEGRYIVMRLLPQANGEVRYRIRSEDTPSREYTAEASELLRVPSGR
jgi:hypothetical protein